MATNLSIECADRSVRWYLTPGQSSRYEIVVINKSGDEHIECTMSLDEPPGGGTFEPASFTLRPRERKIVALTFGDNTQVPRDQLALISVRDANGDLLATLERGLISAGGTDCTIQLAWKEPILDGADVRGFVVNCAIKSLSATAGQFALQFTPHPALEFVDVAPIRMEPGQTQTVAVPILWKRSAKDAQGNNHPHVIEIGVAVSQGKRTGRLSWDVVENKLAALAPQAAAAAASAPTSPAPPPARPAPVAYSQLADALEPEPAPEEPPQPTLFEAPDAQAQRPPVPMPPAVITPSPAPAVVVPPPPPWMAPAASVQPFAPPPPPVAPPMPTVAASVPGDVSEQPPDVLRANIPAPDYTSPENDDELMSLLVGKPVSPPAGWRGPGRDAPDAPDAPPPSIFARTPPTVTKPAQSPPPPRPPQPPAQPPPAQAPLPPPRIPAQQRPQPATAASVETTEIGQPYRLTYTAPSHEASEVDEAAEPSEATGIFGESALESSVVGPPPSLARTIEAGKEHKAASARRTTDYAEPAPRSHESQLPTLVIGGTALIALALAVFFYIRPHAAAPPPGPVAVESPTVPPAVVLETPQPAPSRATVANRPSPGASPKVAVSGPVTAPSIAPSSAARVAVQATQKAVATNAPAPPRPAPTNAPTPKPERWPAPKPRPARHHSIAANPNVIVAIQGVDAHYGPGGHAVRILWGANGQATAHVQLQDDKGGVLSQTDVPGGRQNAVLYIPRTYHGSVFVQVVSQGALGERVTQSTSLPAFAH